MKRQILGLLLVLLPAVPPVAASGDPVPFDTKEATAEGIAAFLEGRSSDAEELLSRAAAARESDFVETLRYLGASQLQEGKPCDAMETFRKALVLREDDTALLQWMAWARRTTGGDGCPDFREER